MKQRKGENDRRKHFMINLREGMLPTRRGSNLQPPDHKSDPFVDYCTCAEFFFIRAQQTHDVYTTSPQRQCNVMTLHRRETTLYKRHVLTGPSVAVSFGASGRLCFVILAFSG